YEPLPLLRVFDVVDVHPLEPARNVAHLELPPRPDRAHLPPFLARKPQLFLDDRPLKRTRRHDQHQVLDRRRLDRLLDLRPPFEAAFQGDQVLPEGEPAFLQPLAQRLGRPHPVLAFVGHEDPWRWVHASGSQMSGLGSLDAGITLKELCRTQCWQHGARRVAGGAWAIQTRNSVAAAKRGCRIAFLQDLPETPGGGHYVKEWRSQRQPLARTGQKTHARDDSRDRRRERQQAVPRW